MKKILALAIGVGMVAGTTLSFAQGSTDKRLDTKKNKGKKKSKNTTGK